jgi:hypothetical protein
VRRRRPGGQAALELLALVPLLLVAALLAWQLAAVVGAGMRAQERVRAEAIRAGGHPGGMGMSTVTASEAVPVLLPGGRALSIRARATVRTP